MRRIVLLAAVAAALLAIACGGASPTAVGRPAPAAVTQDSGGTVTASTGGKITISGVLDYVDEGVPSRDFVTPSGVDHFFEDPVTTIFSGSIEGYVTFTESGASHLNNKGTYHGPFEGDVTWAGRDGKISGMWTTVCEFVPTPTCGGTFEAQGSGGLKGVRFHIVWGPGFYPFDYMGFAIDTSR
jgi:hypothetical protein